MMLPTFQTSRQERPESLFARQLQEGGAILRLDKGLDQTERGKAKYGCDVRPLCCVAQSGQRA